MTEQNDAGASATDALDMAVGTAVAAALANDGVTRPVDLTSLPTNCLNCGAAVIGRYCTDCGQTTDTHVPTLGEVFGDAVVSIFNLDSRLWRTFLMLFFHPGRLTLDFLAGRRARYVPPLRLYLALSVLLFLITSLDPSNNDNDDDEVDTGGALTQEQQDALETEIDARVDAELDEALRNVSIPGITDTTDAASGTAATEASAANATAEDPDPNFPQGVDFDLDDDGNLTVGDAEGNRVKVDRRYDCDGMDIPGVDRGDLFDSAVREACNEGKADDFDSIQDTFIDNIPLLAFMVIPAMAIVFKLFYMFTGRNYLAHLVFLCHTHAFTFLLFVVLTVMRMTGNLVPSLSTPFAILGGALFLLYLPVYYFLSMRRVYGQGVMLTLLKQLLLMFLYVFVVVTVFSVGFVVVMLAT